MTFLKFNTNPWKLYLVWILLFLLFCFIGIPILNKGHSGGEQIPLILLSYSIEYFIYGLLAISLLTPLIYPNWFRKYWYVSFGIAFICLYFIISIYA